MKSSASFGVFARTAVRSVAREFRGARMRMVLLVSCLAIGVAAVAGVSSLSSSLRTLLRTQSRELLGGDVAISSRRAPVPDVDPWFADVGGATARTDILELPTMVAATLAHGATRSRLASLEAIDGFYPLRGTLKLSRPGDLEDLLSATTAIVAPELLNELGIEEGDRVRIGHAEFDIAAVLLEGTDQLGFSFAAGPRVLVTKAGLERAALVTFGSRITYKTLLSVGDDVDRRELGRLRERLKTELPDADYFTVESYDQGQPMVRRSLSRVEDFLGLVALLSLLLGGVGVAQIVRTWLESRTQNIAILRCLGFRPRDVGIIYLSHIAIVAAFGSVLGGLLGGSAPQLAAWFVPDFPAGMAGLLWHPSAVGKGLFLGVSTALLFSLSPLMAAWSVPPARTLRSSAEPLHVPRWTRCVTWGLVSIGIFAASWLQGRRFDLAIGFTLAVVVTGVLLVAGARLLIMLARRAPRTRLGPYLRHGVAALARPSAGTTGAIVSLGLGILVIVTLELVARRLDGELSRELPESAPSVYLWDVQPSQGAGVRRLLEEEQALHVKSVPVVMARLAAVDGVSVAELLTQRGKARQSEARTSGAETRSDSNGGEDAPGARRRGRWMLTREQRLTSLESLPSSNRIVSGELWSRPDAREISLEVDFARNLGATVGTRLEFNVQGVPMEFLVTSLREVEWRSFDINFFLVAEPGTLDGAPQFRLVGARLPAESELGFQGRLGAEYANVTVIRVRPILEKLREILSRLAAAVRVLAGFSVIVGLVVLAGAIGAATMRRAREAALLRALGLTRRGVALLLAIEFTLVGAVAGVVGTLGSFALAAAFLDSVLEISPQLPYTFAFAAVALTSALVALCGIAVSARVLRASPLEILRQT